MIFRSHYTCDKIFPICSNKFDINTQRDIKKELPTIFPDANRRGDQIRIICTTLWKYGTDQYLKHAVCIAPCNTDETDADICECAQNERELLIKWFAFIKNTDPDVLMGWNIYGFDDEYIYKRLKLHDLTDLMTSCTRISNIEGSMKDAKLVTAAYGSNFFRIMDMPGIVKVIIKVINVKHQVLVVMVAMKHIEELLHFLNQKHKQ